MITAQPLPSWGALAGLLRPGRHDPTGLATPWLGQGGQGQWFSRSAWALAALVENLQARLGRAPVVWVPDYFCNGSLEPLRRIVPAPVFYPIGPNLKPVWAECELSAERAAPDAVMLVHYFGKASDGAGARTFCDRWRAMLIEDAAHVLKPASGIGDYGDYCLYSPHKILPVPQGGLVVRRPGAAALPDCTKAAPSLTGWLGKRMLQKLAGPLLPPPSRRGAADFHLDMLSGAMAPKPCLAPSASRLLAAYCGSLDRVAIHRRHIATQLLAVLAQQGGWVPVSDPEAEIPYRVVMRCDDSTIAAHRYGTYRAAGVPVESWPDLAPEVKSAPHLHGQALALRATLLCFPCHQGVDLAEMVARCAMVKD